MAALIASLAARVADHPDWRQTGRARSAATDIQGLRDGKGARLIGNVSILPNESTTTKP
jgi:hypothetical protein